MSDRYRGTTPTARPNSRRVDVDALKRRAPIADVVTRYGVELSPAGRALVGRCPFHDDRNKPNLHVYADTDSYYCYRCGIGGDVVDFIERIERVDFRGAIARLRSRTGLVTRSARPAHSTVRASTHPDRIPGDATSTSPARRLDDIGPEEQACLDAATELYHNRLLSDATRGGALEYVSSRGLDRATLTACRVGYAAGDDLANFLRWRRLPLAAARRVGLLGRGRREFFAGRVIVPEIRGRHTVWLVGRALEADASGPRYLGLRGRKPLMGWDEGHCSPWVILAEGVFDWLALRVWRLPALSLVGTHASGETLEALGRFERVVVAFDRDEAGAEAAHTLVGRLPGAVRLELPMLSGVKDIADLALRPDGRMLFLTALTRVGLHAPAPPRAA